jgi:hypothetical protein
VKKNENKQQSAEEGGGISIACLVLLVFYSSNQYLAFKLM